LFHDGRQCIAAIIPGSEGRPHFAGRAFVRRGTETRDASDLEFETLIAERSSKTRKILEYKGKTILLETVRRHGNGYIWSNKIEWIVSDCNQFFVTLTQIGGTSNAHPVEWIDVSFDTKAGTLILIIRTHGV
jgi:hypothetical protein